MSQCVSSNTLTTKLTTKLTTELELLRIKTNKSVTFFYVCSYCKNDSKCSNGVNKGPREHSLEPYSSATRIRTLK